ncbi:hypothetical protein BC940DRAFT_337878 [Gongronella butleri]|nr:hypothetical protein BC940DRAFT_337878 [Gongronella butleri]
MPISALMAVYGDTKVGFKIDIRLVLDTAHDEHDLLSVEVAKTADNTKLHHDLSKLLREAKDTFDANMDNILEQLFDQPTTWFMQVEGLEGHLGSLQLDHATGMYVAVHQGKIRFPKNLSLFKEFHDTFVTLMSMMSDLERSAFMIRNSIDMADDSRSSFGRRIWAPIISTGSKPGHRLHVPHLRYYSPPRNIVHAAKLPTGLFGPENTSYRSSTSSSRPS